MIDDVEQRPIPYCGSSLPCWELYEAPYCTDSTARYGLRVHGFGDPYHPEIRGQCVVK